MDSALQFYGQKKISNSYYFLYFFLNTNEFISWNAFNRQVPCFDVVSDILPMLIAQDLFFVLFCFVFLYLLAQVHNTIVFMDLLHPSTG